MLFIIFLILAASSAVFQIFVPSNFNSDLPAIIFILVNSMIVIYLLLNLKLHKNKIKNENLIIVVSFLLRIFLVFWDKYCREIFLLPNSGLDTGTFENLGKLFLDGIEVSSAGQKVAGYGTFVGVQFKLFYQNPLIGQFINVLVSVLTIVFFLKILDLLDVKYKYKKYGLYLICFMPNYLIMSAILLRESFITLFLCLTIYYLLKWWKKDNKSYIIYSILFSLMSVYLHTGTIAYTIAVIIIYILANNQDRNMVFTWRKFLLMLIILGGGLAFYSLNSSSFGYISNVSSVGDIVNKAESMSSGGSAYNFNLINDDGILGLIINSPIRIFYFLASPLPWNWRGVGDIIAFIFSSLFYFIALCEALSLLKNKNYKNYKIIYILVIIAISSAFIYSWGVSNAGTALRHRDKFLVNFILLFILAIDSKKIKFKIRGRLK